MNNAYEPNKKTASEPQGHTTQPLQFLVTFVGAYIIYLVLTIGSGDDIFVWNIEELFAGLVLSTIAGYFGEKFLFMKTDNLRMLHPKRWIAFLLYLGPFFVAMAKANIDVAYRVITGKIKPGIVRIRPNMKTDLGVTLLANSITLTPGTLTVDVDEETNDLFIHWINVDESKLHEDDCEIQPVCGSFPYWIRRSVE